MKNRFFFKGLITLLLIFSIELSFAQIQISYSIESVGLIKSKTATNGKESKGYRDYHLPAINCFSESQAKLYSCRNKSYFFIELGDCGETTPIARAIAKTNEYCSVDSNTYRLDKRKKVLVDLDYFNQDWEFTTESKLILGYTCYKATRKRTSNKTKDGVTVITAWYSTEIGVIAPVADAFGLPGLVLEYTSDNMKYSAISIEELKSCEFEIPDWAVKKDSDLQAQYKEMMNNRGN